MRYGALYLNEEQFNRAIISILSVGYEPSMTPSGNVDILPRCAILTALASLLTLMAASLLPATAVAQESDREEVRYTGAHDILVLPVNYNLGSGSAQLAVFVTDPETGAPVPNARVVMLTSHKDESNPGWAFAINSPAYPERYDVHLKLDSTGEWAISVDVSSSLGADIFDVTTLEVPSLNRLTQGSWVFFGMFGVIMLGIAYVWWSARRDYRRKRAAAQADPS